jgi:hypothetical protein
MKHLVAQLKKNIYVQMENKSTKRVNPIKYNNNNS